MNAQTLFANATVSRIQLSVDFSEPGHYILYAYHIIFSTSAVLLSGSVVIGILKTKHLRIQNRFMFMLSTSMSDVITGLYAYYSGLFDVQEGFPSRNGTYNILPSFLGVNLLVFMFAQFDRYCAVCYPFIYERFVSRTVVICVCSYCWFHACVLNQLVKNFMPGLIANQFFSYTVTLLQIVVLTNVGMTIKLFFVAKHQVARDPPSAERDSKAESIKIIIVVVISFLIFWYPTFINIMVKQVSKYGIYSKSDGTNPFLILARFNALSTSGLYIWGSPSLRTAVWRIGWYKVLPQCKRR
ncbi:melatonin receptor type 1B-B-like [Carassius gibelio]|uniref:melatonin receptor type 1B-B-like n=1 Tax=Carassius gibelio TaxID=101364 RepID=UPI002277BC1B|nr:melatonin receptor type 1B-B-like [Carassius gibelio]